MNYRQRYIFRCILILSVLSFACLLLTLYWSVFVIPLLKEISNKEPAQIFANLTNAVPQQLRKQTDNEEAPHEKFRSENDQDQEMREAEEDIRKRKKLVERLCQNLHLGKYKWENNSNDLSIKEPPTPLYSYYFWNRERKLVWCPVYKAGSTSWLKNMMRLAGFSEESVENPPKQLSIWAREIYGDSDNLDGKVWRQSLKLLVVRHPFERLLSAYRDKLANASYGREHGTHHFYQKYGRRIVQKYRTNSTIQQIEPTWEEFVRYILKTDLIQYADDHWLPAYHSCTPCLVDYDIIAKTETYFRDQKFIIKKTGLGRILKPRWSHSTADNESQTRFLLRKKYFSELSKSQVEQLYEKYKLDFLLFGYSHEHYVKLARKA